MRGVVERMLAVEYINYSIPTRYDPATDTVVDENGLNIPIDFAAEQLAADKLVANEVAAAVKTWQFKDELTVDEYRRLMLLNKLLGQQLNGKTVGKGAIARALTPAEFADYRNSLTQPQSFVEVKYADGVPDVLKRYNIMLRDADFQYNKYEKMYGMRSIGRANFKSESLKRTMNKAEQLYEHALEYLQEQIGIAERDNRQGELMHWFDRDIDFTTAGNLGIDADGVPRVRGSSSPHAQDAGLPKLSVRLKREQRVLENLLRAAVACAYVPEPEVVVTAPLKLKRLDLSKINSEKD